MPPRWQNSKQNFPVFSAFIQYLKLMPAEIFLYAQNTALLLRLDDYYFVRFLRTLYSVTRLLPVVIVKSEFCNAVVQFYWQVHCTLALFHKNYIYTWHDFVCHFWHRSFHRTSKHLYLSSFKIQPWACLVHCLLF